MRKCTWHAGYRSQQYTINPFLANAVFFFFAYLTTFSTCCLSQGSGSDRTQEHSSCPSLVIKLLWELIVAVVFYGRGEWRKPRIPPHHLQVNDDIKPWWFLPQSVGTQDLFFGARLRGCVQSFAARHFLGCAKWPMHTHHRFHYNGTLFSCLLLSE